MEQTPDITGIVRLNHSDWRLIGGYWGIALPLMLWYNVVQYDWLTAVCVALLAFVLDTALVACVLASMPFLASSRTFPFALAVMAILFAGLALLYLISYGYIFHGGYRVTWSTWFGGLLQHGRSYVLLLVITGVRKAKEIFGAYIDLYTRGLRTALLLQKTRVNPHFTYNTINAIYNTLEKGDQAQSLGLLAKFSDLLGYRLYDSERDFIGLEEELQHLMSYLDLQAIRFGRNCYRLDVQEPSGYGQYQIAPGILMQYLENAFKHGFDNNHPVVVGWCMQGAHFQFWVQNHMIHRNPEKGRGYGQALSKQLLEIFYNKRHSLSITDDGKLFTVKLEIDLS